MLNRNSTEFRYIPTYGSTGGASAAFPLQPRGQECKPFQALPYGCQLMGPT